MSDSLWQSRFDAISRAIGNDSRASINRIALSTDRPDPFRVLIATIISLRTRDPVTFAASDRLFDEADTPAAMVQLTADQIASLIYPAGFYRTKAQNILKVCHELIDRFASLVPASTDELVRLPGVGRKTANLVLAVGHGIDAICVDIHVHRISNRLGWVQTRTPDQTEMALAGVVPRRFWIPLNEWLVRFGQQICTPQSPWCTRCPLAGDCPRVGVERSR